MSSDSLHTDTHFVNEIIEDYLHGLDEDELENINNVDLIIYIQQLMANMYGLTMSTAIKKLSYGYINQLICYYLLDKNIPEKGIYYETYGPYNFEPSESELDYGWERYNELLTRPHYEQKSDKWFKQREGLLTASTITNVIKGSESNKRAIIKSKCCPTAYKSGVAAQHGIKYEDIACRIYEKRNKVKVGLFGCIEHDFLKCIGASPDGIREDGIMLEIKCPYSRIPNGIVPDMYYDQMQLQLEVCDQNLCHFLEVVIKEYQSEQEYYEDFYEQDGVIDETLTREGFDKGATIDAIKPSGSYQYYFSQDGYTHNSISKWVKKTLRQVKKDDVTENYVTYYPKYWKVVQYSCVPVYRDLNWLNRNIHKIVKVWKRVLYYRRDDNIQELLQPKNHNIDAGSGKKLSEMSIKKSKKCLIVDDSDEDSLEVLVDQKISKVLTGTKNNNKKYMILDDSDEEELICNKI